MNQTTETLIKSKFLVLLGHLFLVIVLYYTREDNIYAGVKKDARPSDSEFENAEASMLSCLSFMVGFLLFELGVLFIGMTINFDSVSIASVFFHGVGVLALIWFYLLNWNYLVIWYIFAFGSFIPFAVELASVLFTRLIFKLRY